MALIQTIRDSGITVIMVEHLVKAVFGVANRIVVLNAGDLIAGTAAELPTMNGSLMLTWGNPTIPTLLKIDNLSAAYGRSSRTPGCFPGTL